MSQAWHRGYKREEIQRVLAQLRKKHHRLFVMMAAESGLRSHVLMQLNYGHIKEDLEAGTTPVAIRLEPRFYTGKKAAGYTFLGDGSVRLIRECLDHRLIDETIESRLIPRSYYAIRTAIHSANRILGLDPKIQTCHGFRKYFENRLDEAKVDYDKKMIIEGHFAGTRAKHYTDRDLEQLRELYRSAYSSIALSPDCDHGASTHKEWRQRLVELENKLAKQTVLEARLVAVEDELEQLRKS